MRFRLIMVIVLAFALGAGVAIATRHDGLAPFLGGAGTVTSGKALVGGAFTLTDHTGERVTPEDFAGRYMLVYFGFTYCPDVCPSGLQVITQAIEALPADEARQVVPLFITIDPERDDVEQMASYVSHFHPRLVGLTGTPDQIAKAAKAYRVYYAKVEDEASASGYTMDHTAITYLMGPDGSYLAHFPHGSSAPDMTARLGEVVE